MLLMTSLVIQLIVRSVFPTASFLEALLQNSMFTLNCNLFLFLYRHVCVQVSHRNPGVWFPHHRHLQDNPGDVGIHRSEAEEVRQRDYQGTDVLLQVFLLVFGELSQVHQQERVHHVRHSRQEFLQQRQRRVQLADEKRCAGVCFR